MCCINLYLYIEFVFQLQTVSLSMFHKYNETFRTPETQLKVDLPIDLRTLYIEDDVNKSDEDLDALCSEQFRNSHLVKNSAMQ